MSQNTLNCPRVESFVVLYINKCGHIVIVIGLNKHTNARLCTMKLTCFQSIFIIFFKDFLF